jgi:Tfp pilus assembly protein PilF
MDITVAVNGAFKANRANTAAQDILNMKKRLSALLDNQDKLDDPDWLRKLFGEELKEIGHFDIDDEDSIQGTFGGFNIEWDEKRFRFETDVDDDVLLFVGDPAKKRNQTGAVEVSSFLGAIKTVFPRLDFHFISYCYIYGGEWVIFIEGEEDEEDFRWDDENNGEKKKDAYVAWRSAYREMWLLEDWVPADKLNTTKEKLQKAEAAFKLEMFQSLCDECGEDPCGCKSHEGYEDGEVSSEKGALFLAVKHPDRFLEIPEKFRTKEVCLAAVKSIDAVCAFIPKNLQSEEFFIEAVKTNALAEEQHYLYYNFAFKYIPEKHRTEKVCLEAMTQKVFNIVEEGKCTFLQYIPYSSFTQKLCLAVVNMYEFALSYIPVNLITAEICLAAVQKKAYALKHIPEELQSEEFFIEAAKVNGQALLHIPVAYKTKKVCETALQQHPDALDADELNNIGWDLFEKGDYDTGILLLDKAIEKDSENQYAWDSRGECYFSKGDFIKAVADFKKAVELDPDDQGHKDNLAKAEAELKKQSQAAKPQAQTGTARTCTACGTSLRAQAKFCSGGGVKQAVACANCGKQPREGAKFCSGCGGKL